MMALWLIATVLQVVFFAILFLRMDFIHIRITDLEKLIKTKASANKVAKLREELKN